jgi:serine/threonine protein kinase
MIHFLALKVRVFSHPSNKIKDALKKNFCSDCSKKFCNGLIIFFDGVNLFALFLQEVVMAAIVAHDENSTVQAHHVLQAAGVPLDAGLFAAVASLRNFREDLERSRQEEMQYLRACQKREADLARLRQKLYYLAQAPLDKEEPIPDASSIGEFFDTLTEREREKEASLSMRRRFTKQLSGKLVPESEHPPLFVQALTHPPLKPLGLRDPSQLEHTRDSFNTDNATLRRRFTLASQYLYPRKAVHMYHPWPCLPTHMPGMTRVFMDAVLSGKGIKEQQEKPPQGSGGKVSIVELTHEGHKMLFVKKSPIAKHRQPEQVANLCLACDGVPQITPLAAMTESTLFFPFFPEGDLCDRMSTFTEDEFLTFALDAAAGMNTAHQKGFKVSDFKAENVLSNAGHALLCDLGHASALEYYGGTPYAMAPELYAGQTFVSRETDVFSFGVFLFEYLNFSFGPEESVFMNCDHFEQTTGLKFPKALKDHWRTFDEASKAAFCRTADNGRFFETMVRYHLTDPMYQGALASKDSTGLLRVLAQRCLAVRPEERPKMEEVMHILSTIIQKRTGPHTAASA